MAAHDCLCGRAPEADGARTPSDAGFVRARAFDGVRRVRQGAGARPGTRGGAAGCGRPAASCERAQGGHHRRLPLSRAMNTSGCLAHRLRTLVTLCGLGLGPSVLSAQKALVYCPVGIDPTGCATLVQSLGDSGGPFAQRVDMGYDGTDGTIDLASADLSPYAVFIVPALADNADTKPYDRLRTATVASRLRNVLLGRIAVWSGTPDQGAVSRTEKNTLVRNLAVWGAANYATSGLRGLVVLQDYSDSLAQRYGWVAEISRLAVAADSAPGIYNEVQALTATATQLLNNGGQQLAYTDMASFGIEPPGDSSGATADARGGTSGSQVVLVSSLGHGNGAATVKTDQADYAPGQVVTITGSGWQFGEVVSLVLHEDPAIDTHPTLTATADASGHIFNNEFAPDVHDVGVRVYMTCVAKAQFRVTFSGVTAPTTTGANIFTTQTKQNLGTLTNITTQPTVTVNAAGSGRVGVVSVGAQTGTLTYGTAGGVAFLVTVNRGSGTGAFTANLTLPVPAGASFTFSPSSLSFGSTENVKTSTLTMNTASTTPAGSTTFTVQATNSSDATDYGQANGTLTVNKANQTITFSALADKTFGDADFTVSATASSGLAESFSASGNCTVAGSTVHIAGAGSCTITASQGGNPNYNPAAHVAQTFAIGKANQTITSSALADHTYGAADFTVSATTSSGLGVNFSASGNCTVSSSSVHITGARSCTITASQGGNANYNPAPDVSRTFAITKANHTISVGAPAGKTDGDPDSA